MDEQEATATATAGLASIYGLPGHLVRRSHQISVALFAEECVGLDLTPVQFPVLMAVREHPGIEAARVTELIAYDRSTLGDVLDRLASKGLIKRLPSERDGRAKSLWLTERGTALIEDAIPAVLRAQQRLLAPLREPERAACVDLLRRLVGRHSGDAHYGD